MNKRKIKTEADMLGDVLKFLADRCRIDSCGIEISVNMVAEAKRKCPGMDIRVSGLTAPVL